MNNSAVSEKEEARLATISKLKILDSQPEPVFDHIVELAAGICDVPISAISIVARDRQWFKAKVGMNLTETPREFAFCSHTVQRNSPFIVTDATQDELFSKNPLVTGDAHLRFYCGIPITVFTDDHIGSLCVIDSKPRKLTDFQINALKILADLVSRQFMAEYQRKIQAEIEADLEQQRLYLTSKSKMSAIGEMAAGIAHEINNPLAVILSRAGTLIESARNNKVDTQEVLALSEIIENTGLRISKTIKALKGLAREGDQVAMEDASLAAIFEDTLEVCRSRFTKNDIQFQVQPPPPEVTIHGRAVQISQVLLNLLNNAFDAVEGRPDARVELIYRQQQNEDQIVVSDNGSGIAAKIRGSIMSPFVTTKPAGKGTGLGLSISQKIIQDHGGSIVLESPANPTRFVISLPMRFEKIQS